MSTSWMTRLEAVANVSVIGASVLLAFVLVSRRTTGRPSEHQLRDEVQVGEALTLEGIDWAARRQTLLLALSKDCHFCSESADFYARLEKKADGKDIQLLAILPHPPADSGAYLQSLGLSIKHLRDEFIRLRVRGTPTLLLVNEQGTVARKWRGKLSPALEEELLSVVEQLPPTQRGS